MVIVMMLGIYMHGNCDDVVVIVGDV